MSLAASETNKGNKGRYKKFKHKKAQKKSELQI